LLVKFSLRLFCSELRALNGEICGESSWFGAKVDSGGRNLRDGGWLEEARVRVVRVAKERRRMMQRRWKRRKVAERRLDCSDTDPKILGEYQERNH